MNSVGKVNRFGKWLRNKLKFCFCFDILFKHYAVLDWMVEIWLVVAIMAFAFKLRWVWLCPFSQAMFSLKKAWSTNEFSLNSKSADLALCDWWLNDWLWIQNMYVSATVDKFCIARNDQVSKPDSVFEFKVMNLTLRHLTGFSIVWIQNNEFKVSGLLNLKNKMPSWLLVSYKRCWILSKNSFNLLSIIDFFCAPIFWRCG